MIISSGNGTVSFIAKDFLDNEEDYLVPPTKYIFRLDHNFSSE